MSDDFTKRITEQVVGIGKSGIPSEAKDVLRVLYNRMTGNLGKVTQEDLVRILPQLGNHPKHEKPPTMDTTLRKVRQIIRDLRVKHWAPILSDKEGYWIPQTKEEAQEYMNRVEGEIRARVAASFETYKCMKESLGIANTFLDKQASLLEGKDDLKATAESTTQKDKCWEQYRVAGRGWICNCPGYRYRKQCKHTDHLNKTQP